MNNAVIECRGLTRDFGTVRALDALSLSVPKGTIFGFLGPNGSGKTTTIRLLLGLLEPSYGQAMVLGNDTRTGGQAIREHSGALLEHSGLYERMSAEENLEFYGRACRMSSRECASRIREMLGHLSLWDRRKEIVGTWSRGMKQKLSVARALLHRPALIFLDEPTAGLDPVAAAALREDLLALVALQDVTVFLTTHNLTEAEKMCGQVAVLRSGKLVATGSPQCLRAGSDGLRIEVVGRGFTKEALASLGARPEVAALEPTEFVLSIRLSQEADSAPLISDLVAHGAQIEEVRRGRSSLEDAFLSLVKEDHA